MLSNISKTIVRSESGNYVNCSKLKIGKKQVLNDISFNARKREVTALIGVNGIGKTTIMNCIAGLFDKREKVVTDDMPARK